MSISFTDRMKKTILKSFRYVCFFINVDIRQSCLDKIYEAIVKRTFANYLNCLS